MAVVLTVAWLVEIAIAVTVLKGSRRTLPRLARFSDLGLLGAAAALGALSFALVGALGIALLENTESAAGFARATTLAHFAGILAVAPLFFEFDRSPVRKHVAEIVLQWISAFGMLAVISAAAEIGLTILFSLLLPLVWGAARLGGRQFLVQFVIVLTLIAQTPSGGESLVSADGVDPQLASLRVQIFLIAATVVVLAVLALSSANNRLLRVSQFTIAASITAFADLRKTVEGWTILALNDAARLILGDGPKNLREVFTEEGAHWVETFGDRVSNASDTMGGVERLVTRGGRTIQANLAPLGDLSRDRRGDRETQYLFQFNDVTDSMRDAEAQEIERRRAGEVQRALLPGEPPRVGGWDIAAACHPSREVGGDFYSWSLNDGVLTVSLGDVMGKGLGAGVMAASVQMAVSLRDTDDDPGVAINSVASAVLSDMERASTFATLFFARIGTGDGYLRYTEAGHGLASIVSAEGVIRRLNGHGVPIGIMADSTWDTKTDRLESGETLLIVSDGVLDAFDAGQDALVEVSHFAPASSSAQELVDRIVALADRPTIVDDVTVLVVRRL